MLNTRSLTCERLADGFCLAIDNAYRLVEDGENLLRAQRYLGAIGLFTHAMDELMKAHVISRAPGFREDDASSWDWFWRVLADRKEKLDLLERDIHPNVFRNKEDEAEMRRLLKALRSQFVYADYREETSEFALPGGAPVRMGGDQKIAKLVYRYVLALFSHFNFYGKPNPQAVHQVFCDQRDDRLAKALEGAAS